MNDSDDKKIQKSEQPVSLAIEIDLDSHSTNTLWL